MCKNGLRLPKHKVEWIPETQLNTVHRLHTILKKYLHKYMPFYLSEILSFTEKHQQQTLNIFSSINL